MRWGPTARNWGRPTARRAPRAPAAPLGGLGPASCSILGRRARAAFLATGCVAAAGWWPRAGPAPTPCSWATAIGATPPCSSRASTRRRPCRPATSSALPTTRSRTTERCGVVPWPRAGTLLVETFGGIPRVNPAPRVVSGSRSCAKAALRGRTATGRGRALSPRAWTALPPLPPSSTARLRPLPLRRARLAATATSARRRSARQGDTAWAASLCSARTAASMCPNATPVLAWV